MINIIKMTSFNVNFSLLYFEQQYLGYHSTCMHQILHIFSKHSNLGKCLRILIQALDFILYEKTGNFFDFFYLFAKFHLLHPLKLKLMPISTF